jgi:hypothetical protein
MNRRTNYPRCQTLRLDERLDDLLTEAAYDRHTSKANWIRSAIRRHLGITTARPGGIAKTQFEQEAVVR